VELLSQIACGLGFEYPSDHLEGQKVLVTRDTLSNMEARLSVSDFIRIHRSFIVSMHKIETFTSDTIGIASTRFQ